METSNYRYRLLHLFLVLFFFSCCCCCCCMGNNSTDREILLSFKSQYITSDPLNALGGWNNSSPLCAWPGISCADHERTHVRDIVLAGFGLSGIIPPLLSNLSSLQILDLSDNSFHGPIPEHLGRLSLLRRLVLHNNSLTGTIPRNLSNCLNLEEIRLTVNQLSGSLPSSLGFLTQLKNLDVSHNDLSGPIPPSFGNLTSLIYLYLARNRLSGEIPQQLGNLQNLINLQISQNQLTGLIPFSVYNISSLQFFSVTRNKLTGQLPEDIGLRLPKLNELYMSGNQFDGLIPGSLSNMSGIKQLWLSRNRFHGAPPSFGNMHDLLQVNLANNRLSSTTDLNRNFFSSLMNCTHLEAFSLTSNQLAGHLPTTTGNLSSNLKDFSLDYNQFVGYFPQGLHNYRNLSILDIQHNLFTGSVPHSLILLNKLDRLSLQQNSFVGEIPDIFSNLTLLFQLNLSDNQFHGKIPKSIGECQRLEYLDLSGNNLIGNIPKEIFNLRGLTKNLSLARNFLNGSLPLEVGNLDKLGSIDISDNQLSGMIPVSIGDCSSLQSLTMARNQFEGQIPESFSRVAALDSLDLSFNRLSGEIPAGIVKLRFLSNLNLSFNDLQGNVPVEGVFMNLSWDSLQGNKGLCSDGQITQKKLRLPSCNKNGSSSLVLKISIPIASVAALLSVLACFRYIANSRRQANIKRSSRSTYFRGRHMKISYEEISSVTNYFDSKNLIGKGGFGSVYKGTIVDETGQSIAVAIKVVDLKQSRASVSFASECNTLKNIRHRNLVKIITSCSSIDHSGAEFKALVMELMSNGSLDQWLHPETSTASRLSLLQRLNISIDIASAMDYLHHDCDPPVAHCDLKPTNVLLDDEMTAHVADFGLSRFLLQIPENQSSSLALKGSIGYIAPEYGFGSRVSATGDVYSYGVLLLEIFTGKKPTDDVFQDALKLNKFATIVSENRVVEIVDRSLLEEDDGNSVENSYSISSSNNTKSSNIDDSIGYENIRNGMGADWRSRKEECLAALVRVGLSCTAYSPWDRPSMRETLSKMQRIKESLLHDS